MPLNITALNPGLDRLDLWHPSLDDMEPSLDDSFIAWTITGRDSAATDESGSCAIGKALFADNTAWTRERSAFSYLYIPTPVTDVAHSRERGRCLLAGYDWITRAM